MTSLAEQLNRLKAPQTSVFVQSKKKPSLLFDPKEAAALDRQTVLNLGLQGLNELTELNKRFVKFADSLFAESTVNLERAVRTDKENKKLDEAITEFLVLASPYFLINSTHKALEWLIHRFRIHEYNKDAFLMLILPYHESRMFIRALQLTDLSLPGDKWHWLKHLQKAGKPLGLLVLLKQLCSDNGLLKIIADHVVFATTVYMDEATCLTTLHSFYTQSYVGWLSRAPIITEPQINYILPALTAGLSSTIPNFSAGSYMILAQLVRKIQLLENDANIILVRIVKQPVLKTEAMLMVLFMYDNPFHPVETMSDRLMTVLVKSSWIIESLKKLKEMEAKMDAFMTTFLIKILNFIISIDSRMETDENPAKVGLDELKDIVMKIVDDVKLNPVVVNAMLGVALDTDLTTVETTRPFFAELYSVLERRYPETFDDYLKKLMASAEKGGIKKDFRRALRFLTTWHQVSRDSEESLDVISRLNHHSPEQRISGLHALASRKFKINESLRSSIVSAVLARFDDHEPQVVNALLAIPVKTLENLLSTELVDKLLVLISTCHSKKRKFLAGPALNVLLNVHRDEDDLIVFLSALPFLFPCSDDEVGVSMQVLKSNYAKTNPYMQALSADIKNQQTAENIRSMAFHHLLNRSLLPETNAILAVIEELISGDAASLFFNMMVLGSICRVQMGHLQINEARKSIELIHKMMSVPNLDYLPDTTQMNSETLVDALKLTENNVLPLQAATYVLEMVHRRVDISSNSTIDFERQPERSNLILRLIEIYFSGMSRLRWKKHYQWCLRIFFQRHFATAKDMLRFFCRLFVKPVKVITSFHCLHIVKNLLQTCKSISWIFEDKIFVPHLLLALSSDDIECRKVAVEILKKLLQTFNLSAGGFHALLQELVKRETEIMLDADQLSLILYMLLSPDPDVSHQHQPELRNKLKCSRELLFEIIQDETTPTAVVSQLLQLLVHVNSGDILDRLVPLGTKYLQSHDNEFSKNALKYILLRFNSSTAEALKRQNIWNLFEKSISSHDVSLDNDGEKGLTTPSIIVLKQIDETFYTRLNQSCPETAKNVLDKLVDIVTYCNVSTVVTTASRVVRRIRIDAQMIVDELKKMIGTKTNMQEKPRLSNKSQTKKRRSLYVPTSPEVVNTNEWRRGQTILEFVQDANNVDNEHLLVPVLLDLLKMCLRFEEQNPLEYTNQLVLSTLHHLAKKNIKHLKTGAHFHIGLIAQCIRTSHNPQTHHHALLLLVELFKVADIQGALHQVMQIFTFMGNSVLRQDDAYSIQIISKTIETIVPIISSTNNEKHACELLRIFITSLPDIPEHRRRPLFCKLLQLMQNYLHLFYLLTLDSHVKTPQASQEQKSNLKTSEKLAFALQMAQEFEPRKIVEVCVRLLMFLQELPVSLDVEDVKKKNFPYKHIFDLKNCTPRDLRYIKYVTIQFLTALLSAPEFINKVAMLSHEESLKMKSDYDQLIVKAIVLIGSTSKMIQPNNAGSKYWTAMLRHEYEALDCINNLLPNVLFLETVKRLINHDIVMVRRKTLELLNARLHQKMFSEEDYDELLELINPLMDIVGEKVTANNQDLEIIQQHALVGLKFLAKLLAVNQQNAFIPVLERATMLLKTREGPVLANAALCVAELCSSIGPYAVQSLNKFFPEILRLLDSQCCQEVPDITVISIVSAMQKIIESVGRFISKDDLQQLLIMICKLSSFYAQSENPKVEMVMSRIKATVQKLSSTNSTPLRILLPAIRRTYDIIVENKDVKFISPLMGILSESFHTIQSSDLNTLVFNSKEQDLTSFFLNVFEFREQVAKDDKQITLADIVSVEESASKALVSLVLKLSETTFRPLYYKFYDWAARNPNKKNRNITFYRLSANIAECLKSLFILFAGHFIKHASDLLAANHIVKTEMTENDESECDDSYKIELTEAILLTLTRTFEHDAHDFVNQERFDLLMTHLVDQLENTLGSVEDYEKRTRELVVPCIAAFANAISDDSLHYKLVYHVILKSHHEKIHVRIAVLDTLVEIARKLGKDFMPLLLEIIPMLSEMQEDEEMEKSVHRAMWALEDILEQPLHKYL